MLAPLSQKRVLREVGMRDCFGIVLFLCVFVIRRLWLSMT